MEPEPPVPPVPDPTLSDPAGNMHPGSSVANLEGELPVSPVEPPKPYRGLKWIFIGPHGLRAFWSALIFLVLWGIVANALGFAFLRLHLISRNNPFDSPRHAFFAEMILLLSLVVSAGIMALIERRNILDYNLRDQHGTRHFFSGLVVGFAALSILVGTLAAGGWLHFGSAALSGIPILEYAAIWGCVFLMVGCFEEGQMRCYLQYTLTRGINFWWAAGTIAFLCGLLFRSKGNGVWGVYAIALLGLLPCLWLHVKKSPQSGFWQAAWLTSTLFGAGHTGNGGENWIGIFSAAFIGFVFCVSIWATGSAWWAIGAHAGWDWGQTYFYGTPDSGFVAPGHLLTTNHTGNPLWSGGADGPEGSLLIIPTVLLILIWLLVIYRRSRSAEVEPTAATEQLAG